MIFSPIWIILILFQFDLKTTLCFELDSTPPLLKNVERDSSSTKTVKRSVLAQDIQDRVRKDAKRRVAVRLEHEMSKKLTNPKSHQRKSRISIGSRNLAQSPLMAPLPLQTHRFDAGDSDSAGYDDSSSGSGSDSSNGSEGEDQDDEQAEQDGEDEDEDEESSNTNEETVASPWPKGSPDAGKTWTLPPHFSNFDPFNITSWVSAGKDNCRVVTSGIPAADSTRPKVIPSASPPGTSTQGSQSGLTINLGGIEVNLLERQASGIESSLAPHSVQSSLASPYSVLQNFFPEGSSNPGSQPVGGCQFYAATSLDLLTATSVTLRYSVYFPPSFNFVRGGKLPGLYGGREGCSGGDDAQDCWSSRMMWRAGGQGELYLYVPRDRQDPALCSIPPYSECNPDYGDSVGRGAFNFTRGAFTQISQTIRLSSTPAAKDGSFNIQVNGGKPTTIKFNKVVFPASFKGIFFSTFFGGHGAEWAATKDENVYFKDFSVTINH